MLLVDHDMGLVLGISDQLVVVESGARDRVRARPAEIRENPHVIEAYLGAADRLAHPSAAPSEPGWSMSAPPSLAVEGLTAGYDGAPVLRNLESTSARARWSPCSAPNGAGKTTTLRAISGIVRPLAGTIRLAGEDLARTLISKPALASGSPTCPKAAASSSGSPSPSTSGSGAAASGSTPTPPTATSRRWPTCADRRCGPALGRRAADARARARAGARMPRLLLLDELSLGLAPLYRRAPAADRAELRGRDGLRACCSWSSTSTRARRSPTAATCSRTASSSSTTTPTVLRADRDLLLVQLPRASRRPPRPRRTRCNQDDYRV